MSNVEGGKKEVSREERSTDTLSNTETLQVLTDVVSYAAFQFCRKVGNSRFKLRQTYKEEFVVFLRLKTT